MLNHAGQPSLDHLLSEIRALHRSVEALALNFRNALQAIEKRETTSPTRYTARYWSLAVVADALVRIRLLIEQHLSYSETLGLLAVTRYVFELTVWVRLVQKDNRYGLLYYRELIDKQKLHYQDLQRHLIGEVAFFLETSEKEKALVDRRLSELPPTGSDAAASLVRHK